MANKKRVLPKRKISMTFDSNTLEAMETLKEKYTKVDGNGKPLKGQNSVTWANVSNALMASFEGSKFDTGKTLIEKRLLQMLHLHYNGVITVGLLRGETYHNGTKYIKVDLKSTKQVYEAYENEINTHNQKFK